MRTRAIVVAGALVSLLGGASVAAPTTAAPSAVALPAPPGTIYWGAYVGGAQYGRADAPWDPGSADQFEVEAKKHLSLMEWGQDWYDCDPTCGLHAFPAGELDAVRASGTTPVLNWGSYQAGGGTDQPDFNLPAILSGKYDSYIRQWAAAASAWAHPFFLRFDWEMNTHQVPYSEASNGNGAGQFVQVWRHVHDLFVAAGATNVTWLWCPNTDYEGSLPVAPLYPGDSYVDWVGLDGYNWGTNPARPGAVWQSFDDVYAHSYAGLVRLAPSKPMMIGEMASSEFGGSKAQWITDAIATRIPLAYPNIHGVVWFNKNAEGMDWIIESSVSAGEAFSAAIANPAYVMLAPPTADHASVPVPGLPSLVPDPLVLPFVPAPGWGSARPARINR